MKILVLHGMGDPQTWRTSMAQHELCLPMFAPDHDYIAHNIDLPLPEFVRSIEFDGIVLGQTFLSRRRDPRLHARVREEYSFIEHSSAFKIALPQDEYDCSGILDQWLVDWGVDLVYPVCDTNWDVLFPQYHKTGRLRQGYTGYLAADLVASGRNTRPRDNRRIDVSYRSIKIMPNYGRLGQTKGAIGERFARAAAGKGLVLDISTDPRDAIIGSRWAQFLENSRFVIGANSGSSILDPLGAIAARVREYVFDHPRASFEEVERNCFPGEDGRYVFTALSPRNIECALLDCAQLLTQGSYGGILEPGQHYIELQPDLSNAADVFAQMDDTAAVLRMTASCKEVLLTLPGLRYETHVRELLDEIQAGQSDGSRKSKSSERELFTEYATEISKVERWHWPRARAIKSVRSAVASLGGRRAKYLLSRARAPRMPGA